MRALMLAFFMSVCIQASAQPKVTEKTETDTTISINFRSGSSQAVPRTTDKNATDSIISRIRHKFPNKIRIIGSASPEGSLQHNSLLSQQRAQTIKEMLETHSGNSFTVDTDYTGRDWEGLLDLVSRDTLMPFRQDALSLLRNITYYRLTTGKELPYSLEQLKELHGGAVYEYMYRKHFPKLRKATIMFDDSPSPIPEIIVPFKTAAATSAASGLGTGGFADNGGVVRASGKFVAGVYTNLLYDALAIPNAGAEFYLGGRWSVAADWMYSWWKNDRTHWYWRTYGGTAEIRRWFGKKSAGSPLTGHHAGIYASMLTYDMELGGRGVLGDKWSWGAGLSYGYSLPVAHRLNIDFSCSFGYLTGEYKEYLPIEDHYVWQVTKMRNYFGPTEISISLVWLIGDGYNGKKYAGKGGSR